MLKYPVLASPNPPFQVEVQRSKPKSKPKVTFKDDLDLQESIGSGSREKARIMGEERAEKEIRSERTLQPGFRAIKVQNGGNHQTQIDSGEFYDQSNYYIDILHPEFCAPAKDDWTEFKEPIDKQVIEDPPDITEEEAGTGSDGQEFALPLPPSKAMSSSRKSGKWTPEEHQLFLEALKMHGKDWEAIHKRIKTRDIKNIRAHAQKFLVKLLKFLNRELEVEKLTEMDARYYYGILNKRIHKTTKKRLLKERQWFDNLIHDNKIFHVEKVRKGQAKGGEGTPELEVFKKQRLCPELREPLSPVIKDSSSVKDSFSQHDESSDADRFKKFNLWKETGSMKSIVASRRSIGFSVNVKQVDCDKSIHRGSLKTYCKFSFKSMLKQEQEEADSQDEDLDGFGLEEYFPENKIPLLKGIEKLVDKALRGFSIKMIEKFRQLEDLKSEDEELVLMLNFGEGFPHVKFSGQTTEKTCISEMYFIHNFKLEQSQPNMYKAFKRVLNEVMDKMNPNESYSNREMTEFEAYIFNEVQTEEGRHRLENNDFKIYCLTEEEFQRRFPERTEVRLGEPPSYSAEAKVQYQQEEAIVSAFGL